MIYINIPVNLKNILNHFEREGVTKTEFSKKIGYTSTSQLNNVLAGKSTLSGKAIIKLIEAFNVNPIFLFYGIGDLQIKSHNLNEVSDGIQNELGLLKTKWEQEKKKNAELVSKIKELEDMNAELLETTNKFVQHYRKSTQSEKDKNTLEEE